MAPHRRTFLKRLPNVAKKQTSGKRVPKVLPHQETAVEKPPVGSGKGWVGRPMVRKEDARLGRGFGKFLDGFKLPGMLPMRLVRSPYAHAPVNAVDVSAPDQHHGAVCTLRGP